MGAMCLLNVTTRGRNSLWRNCQAIPPASETSSAASSSTSGRRLRAGARFAADFFTRSENAATDRRHTVANRSASVQPGFEGVLQFACGRGRAGLAEIDLTVIDAAVINQ